MLATRNQHKVAELRRILESSSLDVDLVGTESFPDLPDVAETGSTFAANALLKAEMSPSAPGWSPLPTTQIVRRRPERDAGNPLGPLGRITRGRCGEFGVTPCPTR